MYIAGKTTLMAVTSSPLYMLIYGSLTELPRTPPMIYLRKFHSWRFLTSSITSTCLNSPTPHQFSQFSSSFWRPFSSTSSNSVAKKPLSVFFQEAVGLIEKSEQQSESEGEAENKQVKCRLRKLEEEVRSLREKRKNEKSRNGNRVLVNEGKSKKLHELFVEEEVKSVKSRKSMSLSKLDYTVYKELSSGMVMFVTHLYNEGYFKDSNFLPTKKFDVTCFENSYARDFVKHAAEQFGRDHQEIAKIQNANCCKRGSISFVLCKERSR